MIAAAAGVAVEDGPGRTELDGDRDGDQLQGLSAGETARSMKVSVASVYMAAFRVSRLLNRVVKEIRKTVE